MVGCLRLFVDFGDDHLSQGCVTSIRHKKLLEYSSSFRVKSLCYI